MSDVPSPTTAIDNYLTELKIRTDKVVSSSKELPKDIAFHRTLDRKFRTDLDASSARILKLTNRLLKLAQTVQSSPSSQTSRSQAVSAPNSASVTVVVPGSRSKVAKKAKGKEREEKFLEDEDDVVDKFHSIVVDVVDPLLEQVVSVVICTSEPQPTSNADTRIFLTTFYSIMWS
jgi:exosome complex exonuclease RRP6